MLSLKKTSSNWQVNYNQILISTFEIDDSFEILGGVDPKKENRDLFYEKYGLQAYAKIEDYSKLDSPDLRSPYIESSPASPRIKSSPVPPSI